MTRLRQLPKEDLHQLVFPLLLGRMQKLHPSDSPTVVKTYVELGGAKSDVEAFVVRALTKGPQLAEKLLKDILAFQLSPKFVSSTFSATLTRLQAQDLAQTLSAAFRADPYWVATVIRLLPASAQISTELFDLSFRSGATPLHSPTDEIFPVSPKPSEVPAQMAAAWRLFQITRDYRYSGYYSGRVNSLSSEFASRL